MADATQIRITAVDQTTAAFRSVQGNIGRMTNSLRSIAGPLAAAFSVAAVTSFSKEILNAADNLSKLSQKTGVSVEDLSAFQLSADLAGVSSESFSAAMVKLNRSIADATGGAKLQAETFRALGISQEELISSSPAQILERIADSFANAEDGANKTQIAMNLLGRSGADLIPLLNGGSESLRQFGTTISTEFAKNAEIFNDNLRILQENLRRFTVSVLGPIIKEINQIFGTPVGKELDKAIESAENRVRIYNEQIKEQLRLTPEITKENSIVFRKLSEGAEKAEKELQRLQNARQAALAPPKADGLVKFEAVRVGVLKEEAEMTAMLTERNKELVDIYNKTRQPVDVLNDGLARLNILYEEGSISLDQYLDAQMQLQEAFQSTVPQIKLNDTALKEYAESAKDLRASLDNAAVRGLQNLEDSLMGVFQGTLTVKDAFRNMAASIINDLIRIQIQRSITGPLADALGSLFSPSGTTSSSSATPLGSGIKPKALGGTVGMGQTYMVGEKGPELFIPGKTGTIVPNSQLGGSGAVVNQTINISTGVSQTVRAEIMGLMPQIMESTKAAVVDAKRRGGTFGRAFA